MSHGRSAITATLAAAGFAIALGTLAPSTAAAAVWRVNCDAGAVPDFVTIGAAIAGASDGDTIVVEPCPIMPFFYNETPVVSAFTDLHLVAASPGYFGVRQEGVGAPLVAPPPVVIDGVGLMGPCLTIDASISVAIQAFSLRRCQGGGILIRDSERTLVQGNRIHRVNGVGVLDESGLGTRVVSNQVTSPGAEGIRLEDAKDDLVADNLIIDTDTPAISLTGGGGCAVTNNDARSTGPEGVVVDSGFAHRLQRNRVVSNMFSIIVGAMATNTELVGNDINQPISDAGAGTDILHNF